MNRKKRIFAAGLFLVLVLLASCGLINPTQTPTDAAPTITTTPSNTPYPICTPPPCDPLTEAYHCPEGEGCIGGCGTTCATFTPSPQNPDSEAASLPESSPTPIPTPIRFAVIGDFGLAGEPEAGVAALVASWNPDFIITLGDNNYPDGAANTIDENIGQYYHAYIYPYFGQYGEGADTNRFFPTLGNHDWRTDDARPYLDYFSLPGNERYYDFVWGPVHFFALDSDFEEPDGVGRSSLQAEWLLEQLVASSQPWQVVYFHHAPYSSAHHGNSDWMQWPFKEWGADVVLAGHDHVYERLEIDGLPYFTNGLGGGPRYYFGPVPIEGSQVRFREDHGAILVEATEFSLKFVFETRTHEIIDTYQIGTEPQVESDLPSVQVFPDPAGYLWEPVVSGLSSPVGMAHAGDGSGRLFVIEQAGVIRVVQDGQSLAAPFLDISRVVNDDGNERGLLGLTFHPDYAENGYFFVNYTGSGGDTFISRFQISADPNLADPGTETILLRIGQPFQNHNGGHLVFGPDGYLYIGTGDGGAGGDPQGNAQNPNSLLGKMLRIDVNFGDPYAVPADNPFVDGDGRSEIWALGLRNPWRYSFDRLTGDLYVADVGQNQWEEISFLEAGSAPGENFGWDFWEGFHPYEGSPPQNLAPVVPIWEYDHSLGCSITGGLVYRGSLPSWQGIYLYGDFCTGYLWGLLRDSSGVWQNELLFETGANITSFGEDESGEVYLVDRQGTLYRLVEK